MQELARKFIRCLVKVSETDDLKDNIFKTLEAPLDFDVADGGAVYKKLFKFINDYHAEKSDYPTLEVFKVAFGDKHGHPDLEILEEIDHIRPIVYQTGSGFKFLVEENVKELNRIALNHFL